MPFYIIVKVAYEWMDDLNINLIAIYDSINNLLLDTDNTISTYFEKELETFSDLLKENSDSEANPVVRYYIREIDSINTINICNIYGDMMELTPKENIIAYFSLNNKNKIFEELKIKYKNKV